jgi:membrane protease YdiL (CAAX protease family)
MKSPATLFGLCVALAGPLFPVALFLDGSAAVTNRVIEQLFLWLLLAVLVAVIVLGEKQPLASVGWARPTWRSVVWGAAAAALLLFVVSPLSGRWVEWFHPGAYKSGLAKLQSLPMGLLIFAGITAGVVEEFLYRGYAVERLSAWTGNLWTGALLALAAFVLVHLPFWGLGAALGTLPAGALLTALYVWRRDLASNMIAHASTAIAQLLIVAGGRAPA